MSWDGRHVPKCQPGPKETEMIEREMTDHDEFVDQNGINRRLVVVDGSLTIPDGATWHIAENHERAKLIEECANIALAIDSGRGNEKEIAKAIRSLAVSRPERDGFGNTLCQKCKLPHSTMAECPALSSHHHSTSGE